MLPKHYTNEWLTPKASAEQVSKFLKEQFDRALREQTPQKYQNLSLGWRMHDIMNVFCQSLALNGLVTDHAIFWDDKWMSLHFIHEEDVYTIEFDLGYYDAILGVG